MSVSVDLVELSKELSDVDRPSATDATETTIVATDWLKERIAELEALNAALLASNAARRTSDWALRCEELCQHFRDFARAYF